MSQNISEVLAKLVDEKKSVAAELGKLDQQRVQLLDTQKRIHRAINALSQKSDSKTSNPTLSRETVRQMVTQEIDAGVSPSEQTLKQKLTERLKSAGKSRNGLTKHLRTILSELAPAAGEDDNQILPNESTAG